MGRFLPVLTLGVMLAAPVLAGSANEGLVNAIRTALSSPDPGSGILQGLAKLDDFDLSAADVEAALQAAGAPQDGMVAVVLGGLTEVKKKGGQIQMTRSAPVVVPIVVDGQTKAFVSLDKRVQFTVMKSGTDVTIDKMSGASVGEKSDSLHHLQTLTFSPKSNGATVLTVKAGRGFLDETRVIELPPLAPLQATQATKPAPVTKPAPAW